MKKHRRNLVVQKKLLSIKSFKIEKEEIIMKKSTTKEEKTLKEIGKTIDKLEKYLDEISEGDQNKHVKMWFAQKKAGHEIKRLLHEINHYEEYEEHELETLSSDKYYQQLKPEEISYIDQYFY
jgi:DNA-binding transcriptional regulator GbsR (MarR family)